MTTNPAGPRLLGPAEVRQLAAELDLRPTKQRGQNFVIDANTVRRIVRESGVTAADVVVEVGPGLGSLTLALLEVAGRVIAIEVDPLLAERLPATIAAYAPGQADRFDVVVTDNLFGDILTDLGAAVAGGIGLAASGNINPERTAPSMFEPVHGSAPDIAGQQKADPTAAILSAAMLCDHLGLATEAARIEQAVADDLVERQGAWAARVTPEIGDDIAARVAG